MAHRTRDWNQGLAQDLKDKEFAREYILALVNEGMSVQEVLGKIARTVGIKEFSQIVKIPASNVVRAVNPESNPTLDTMLRLLKPFGLKLSISPIVSKASTKVA